MSSQNLSKPKRLLIVDDEDDLRDVIAHLCLELTEDIKTASNGVEALSIIRTGEVDAVLTDINMPKMTGLQLIEKVRELGMDIPFVILTGYNDKESAVKALRLGVSDFIDKPFDDEKLLSSVDMALHLGVALRAAEEEMRSICYDLHLSQKDLARLKSAHKTLWTIKKDFEVRQSNKFKKTS